MLHNIIRANRKGAVLPLVVLMMFVFFGFTMIAVDASSMYLDRREMATAADAGALAGAKELADSEGKNTTKAREIATEIAEQNGANNGEVEVVIEKRNGIQIIEVIVNKTKDTYFAKIFGINSTDVGARSVATWGFIKDYDGGTIMPLFYFDEYFALGDAILKAGKLEVEVVGNEVVINNNYGYLDFDNGMNIIKNILAVRNYTIPSDIAAEIKIGGIIEGETGNKQSLIDPIEERMDKALALNVSGDGVIPARKQFMTGLIPIVDYDKFIDENITVTYDKNGNVKDIKVQTPLDLPIAYFANFEIQDVIDKAPKGSEHALNTTTYERVASAQTYPGLAKGTIVGEFTEGYLDIDVDYLDNDQTNPNPGGYAAKYFELIDADYIGD